MGWHKGGVPSQFPRSLQSLKRINKLTINVVFGTNRKEFKDYLSYKKYTISTYLLSLYACN